MARDDRRPIGEPLRCPGCGVVFALVVGSVGTCEPCQIEMRAER